MEGSVIINREKCTETGLLIKNLHARQGFYERPFLRISAPVETQLRGYFYAVAICHQTYNLHHLTLNLYGWDYIEHVFTSLMNEQHELLMPGFPESTDFRLFKKLLASLFSADNNPEHTSLDRLEERSGMIIELDRFLKDNFDSSISKLVKNAGGYLVYRGKGYYEILPGLSAFADPRRKKITFLLKLLEEAKLVKIKDSCNFVPIMDYHMQRVLMRLGCVEITDNELYTKLIGKVQLPDDIEIRNNCINAFRLIADISGHQVTKLNDFFWSLGRSCCNIEPLCQAGHCEKEPCTFFEIVELKEHTKCYFESVCKGFHDEKYRNLWQPVVETNYY
jgi:hypothetical protein